MPTRTQSVVFSTSRSPSSVNAGRGWTVPAARNWLQERGLAADRVLRPRSGTQLRFRQVDPARCAPGTFKTSAEGLPDGIQLITCDVA